MFRPASGKAEVGACEADAGKGGDSVKMVATRRIGVIQRE